MGAMQDLNLGTWRLDGNRLIAQAGDHDLIVAALGRGVARLILAPHGATAVETPAMARPGGPTEPLEVEEYPTRLVVRGGHLKITVGREPLHITVEDDNGVAYVFGMAPSRKGDGWTLELPIGAEERCYGLGEKTGYLDRRGRKYTMWNTDDGSAHVETLDPLYVSIPWVTLLSPERAYGLYLDDPSRTVWDVGAQRFAILEVTTPRPILDVYVVAGPFLAQVVERFTALVGRMPLPPRWALGYQQCRWSYETADRIREVARGYRDREIPCDVLYADIDYMDDYRVFTWSPVRFPDPAGLVADLRADGFRLVPIVDPGVKKDAGYSVFSDGLRRGYFCKDRDGVPFIGEVWPGEVAFPDFVRAEVRRWWGDLHRDLVDIGVGGIWNDMNEPSVFLRPDKTLPLDVLHGDQGDIPHSAVHNLYGSLMSQATAEGLERLRPNERPFVLSRSGFAGIQRHAAVWSGDNMSIWPHLEQGLPMAMNLGLSGVSFVGSDVGGFTGDTTGELLARWMQLGAFTPFFRNHSAKGTRNQEPWEFGAEIESICRKAIRLRYELMPYLYTAFWRCAQDGTPILRPLAYDFQDDPETHGIADQAMVGPHLMIAPIMRPLARHRAVYLPVGDWIDVWTGERIDGGTWFLAAGPLEMIPLFARAGAVIPKGPAARCVDDLVRERLELEVVPGPALEGEWYDDDGLSFGHREGAYAHWKFEGRHEGARLSLALRQMHAGYDAPARRVGLVLRGYRSAVALRIDGREVPWHARGGDLVVEQPLAAGEWIFEGLAR